MPSITTPQGQTQYIPGVYSDFEVVSDLPGPLPEWHVPVVMAGAEEGYPFDVKDTMYDHETLSQWRVIGTASAARSFYGADSDMGQAFKWGKRGGLPRAYAVCMSALVRASVLGTKTGPGDEFYVAALKYGAPGGHIKIKLTGGTALEVTPLKHYSRLTQNGTTGDTRIYVRDNVWVKDGQTLSIGDNNSANVDYTVSSKGTSLDSGGQVIYWIELTSALLADITTAEYGLIVEYNESGKETPDTFADGTAMLDWLQDGSSKLLTGSAHGSNTGAALIAVSTATALKDITAWSTVVGGASPAPTSTDYSDFITDLDASEWDAFAESEQVIPQAFLVVDPSSTIHASMNDFAAAKRTEGYPISVTTGCEWGDTDPTAGDDTDPSYRAGVLNSENLMLVAGGINWLAPYLSHAPQVFGRRIGGGIPHNLTNDDLSYAQLEYRWDERNSGELTDLHKAGVCTYRLDVGTSIRWRISQGLSTLQDNSSAWNESDATSPLVMQRDLADFIQYVIKRDLDGTQVGADQVDADTIAGVLVRRAEKSLVKGGYVTEFSITSVTKNASGAGWDVEWRVVLPLTTDYITVVTTIHITE